MLWVLCLDDRYDFLVKRLNQRGRVGWQNSTLMLKSAVHRRGECPGALSRCNRILNMMLLWLQNFLTWGIKASFILSWESLADMYPFLGVIQSTLSLFMSCHLYALGFFGMVNHCWLQTARSCSILRKTEGKSFTNKFPPTHLGRPLCNCTATVLSL